MDLSPAEILLIVLVFAFNAAILFAIVYAAIRLAMRRRTSDQAPSQPPAEAPAQQPPPPRQTPAQDPPIKHAFDFTDDHLTMILEMPVSLLEDDEALAEGWIQVVSWARMTYREILEGKLEEARQSEAQGTATASTADIRSEELEASLQRLHDSAERRRELRMKLQNQQE